MQFRKEASTFFTKGNDRSLKAKKNILQMFFLKGANILIGFILVPLTINYVDNETYGIWITISSIVAWVQFFDIGIGNGLKNRLTEALAQKNFTLSRQYVSTTYAFLCIVFLPIALILAFVIPYLDLQKFLNISSTGMQGLVTSMEIICFYFSTNFILSTINIILTADQAPARASLLTLIQQLVTLIVIYILTKTTSGNLINLSIALCAVPLIVISIFSYYLFRKKYKHIAPNISYVKFSVMPDLMKLGIQFFIIQIAVLIQYQLFNFIIFRYYGAEEVMAYNIGNKLFNSIFMFWCILTTPLWVGVTDAITKHDSVWIKSTMIKYTKICLVFLLVCISIYIISPIIYKIWIGDKVKISSSLSLCLMLYNYNLIVSNLATSFINGAGILKVQTIMSCLTPFVFIALSLIFIHLEMGIETIFIAAIIANINGIIIAPIQTIKYIKRMDFHVKKSTN